MNGWIWWVVDFGTVYYIGEVMTTSRQDCCWWNDDYLKVRVGNASGVASLTNPQCGETYSMFNPVRVKMKSVYCQPYGHGRYLSISRRDFVLNISLCEVAAFRLKNGKNV